MLQLTGWKANQHKGVKDNFLRSWNNEYSDIKVEQIVAVDFDKVCVADGDDLLEIEI